MSLVAVVAVGCCCCCCCCCCWLLLVVVGWLKINAFVDCYGDCCVFCGCSSSSSSSRVIVIVVVDVWPTTIKRALLLSFVIVAVVSVCRFIFPLSIVRSTLVAAAFDCCCCCFRNCCCCCCCNWLADQAILDSLNSTS